MVTKRTRTKAKCMSVCLKSVAFVEERRKGDDKSTRVQKNQLEAINQHCNLNVCLVSQNRLSTLKASLTLLLDLI